MTVRILRGDCREVLSAMPAASVHCCVTSPPYFGLRDYGTEPVDWPAVDYSPLPGLPPLVQVPAMPCSLGLEPAIDAFIGHLVLVFREVRRVLRDDGTLWLNLGDSYCSRPNGSVGKESRMEGSFTGHTEFRRAHALRKPTLQPGLKHKDLMGVPWRAAMALQADGWYLRQDIIWRKSNPMPESVRDRCTRAHEYLFLLSKSERYYWNREAMQEPAEQSSVERWGQDVDSRGPRSQRDTFKRDGSKRERPIPGQSVGTHRPDREDGQWDTFMRNKRSVWSVATEPFRGAHFATFPPALIEPCISAGCPPGGVVLDPFGGSGTTALVADRLQRDALTIELNAAYVGMAQRRITGEAPLLTAVEVAA